MPLGVPVRGAVETNLTRNHEIAGLIPAVVVVAVVADPKKLGLRHGLKILKQNLA